MKYILLAFTGFLVLRLTWSWFNFRALKERNLYEFEKNQLEIEKNPNSAILFCKRGTFYQIGQNFILANLDYRQALDMIEKDASFENKEEIKAKLKMNIKYTVKPLPWSKNGPKDLSRNWLAFFLIERLGDRRFNF